MDAGPVCLPDRVELVNAADASVCQDQGASLKVPLATIAGGGDGQAGTGGSDASGQHGSETQDYKDKKAGFSTTKRACLGESFDAYLIS